MMIRWRSRNSRSKLLSAFAVFVVATLTSGCGDEDDGPSASLAALVTDPREVRLRLRNTGDEDGTVVGCAGEPLTNVEQWTGSWVPAGDLNDECPMLTSIELDPGDEVVYDVTMPVGRFRFFIWMVVDGSAEVLARSNAVDVL